MTQCHTSSPGAELCRYHARRSPVHQVTECPSLPWRQLPLRSPAHHQTRHEEANSYYSMPLAVPITIATFPARPVPILKVWKSSASLSLYVGFKSIQTVSQGALPGVVSQSATRILVPYRGPAACMRERQPGQPGFSGTVQGWAAIGALPRFITYAHVILPHQLINTPLHSRPAGPTVGGKGAALTALSLYIITHDQF